MTTLALAFSLIVITFLIFVLLLGMGFVVVVIGS
jgi:hypothetical protein